MTNRQKKWIMYGIITYVTLLIILAIFPTDSLLQQPLITPTELLNQKPNMLLFNTWIIIVPSSTIIVYLLGIQILFMGYYLFKNNQRTWGASLIFWGIGTILAGTSYQGFGYELKCLGYDYCKFTSWFELSYLLTTAISISLMGFAFAKEFTINKCQTYLKRYSEAILIIYIILLLLGAIIQNQFLVSYELFTLFFMPLFIVFFIINIILYKNKKDSVHKSFIILWVLFLVVNVSYFIYFFLDITNQLYTTNSIWFSANDVLHVGLMLWFAYFFVVLVKLKKRKGLLK